MKQNYKVIIEFDAFECHNPIEAAEQVEKHLRNASMRFVYFVTEDKRMRSRAPKTTIVDLETNGDK